MSGMLELLLKEKIVAIFRGYEGDKADRAAQALVDGGIRLMEVTMNTEGAPAIIARWRERYEGQVAVGAGTVLDTAMAREAVAAGAQYLISPNLDEAVIAYGMERGVSVWPGVMTPTEIVRAWKAGAEAVKVFPMASLGWQYLAEIRAPLDRIPMMATGGVDLETIGHYFKAGANAVGMGSKLLNAEWLAEGAYDKVTVRAKQYVEVVKSL
ncbi:bifunctional 4-hydroxy-2-oxoglutarate aldolase/2-dehydro-3-deoxy-phosphogluconate aldolase [Paenibacillus darwinianus]|uniref:bifunctional 4-hydroxy-2-oxoglutarate aldolase/2-dehydro-3-deoxy-phosphogluconate aldolase n=1 Tax=Paenibacillus darwinianus TaxID=1380763 RepID=UPI000450EA11|nr:bifunctional 4-hydroxy-2-oxoglutarate aldolase/2-dehydro-3-deoxy-phosphogluconate aldolase [Paenibacillus darwinianus]EXX84817.1 2-dehydro-3-deoxyphosphogluconate aldolase [Paenibacillus darwinianus]